MTEFAILVNTCDKFEDCWEPFFKLFATYWPDYNGKIYLNTEYKEFKYPGLHIISVRNAANRNDAHKITWSECLHRALDFIDSEIVLYMQEDYFLKAKVEKDIVNSFVNLMNNQSDIHCIHLTDQAVKAESKSNYDKLYTVAFKQRYRISCQAALWKSDVLKSYLRSYESAWDFEEFGSKRAARLNHNFLVVDSNWVKLNQFEIVPYIFTGIVQGRWLEDVIQLFQQNEIKIDYSLRGFVSEKKKKTLKNKINYYLRRFPVATKSNLELLQIEIQNCFR